MCYLNKYEVLIAGAKVKFYILLLFLHVFSLFVFLHFFYLFAFFYFFAFFLFLCINSWRRRVSFGIFLFLKNFLYIFIFVFVRTVHTNFHAKSGLCSSKNERVMLNLVFGALFAFFSLFVY